MGGGGWRRWPTRCWCVGCPLFVALPRPIGIVRCDCAPTAPRPAPLIRRAKPTGGPPWTPQPVWPELPATPRRCMPAPHRGCHRHPSPSAGRPADRGRGSGGDRCCRRRNVPDCGSAARAAGPRAGDADWRAAGGCSGGTLPRVAGRAALGSSSPHPPYLIRPRVIARQTGGLERPPPPPGRAAAAAAAARPATDVMDLP